MKCSSCEFENPSEAKFCAGCGTQLALICPSCGASCPPGSRFCGHCGGAIDSAAESTPPLQERPPSIESERRHLTMMFCDLVGSTALSEKMDVEDLREVVGRYQEVASAIVDHYSGHVAQYLGDGILVYFGYPQAHEDDPRRAALAGLEIVDGIEKLNRELAQEHGVELAVRIGIHTGDVVTGTVGTGSSSEALAMGSAPNIAARAQGEAEPNQVLLTEATAALVRGHILLRSLGQRSLRGLSEPVGLYEAEQVETHLSRFDPGTEQTPFVGREEELRCLLDLFEKANAGHGQVALISGQPGIGKSRLCSEFREQIRAFEPSWPTCRCSALHQNTALYPVKQLIARTCGFARKDTPAERLSKLEARLQDFNQISRDALPLLASLLSLPATEGETAQLSPERKRRLTFEVLVSLLTEMQEHNPLVVLIEDLHWVDPTTLDFIELLLTRLDSTRILLLLTCRPEFESRWTASEQYTLLRLKPLTGADCARMISEWSIGQGLSADMRNAVVGRADGIPLFLEELARTVVGAQADTLEARGAAQDEKVMALIPNTLRDSLSARLDALGPAKEILQLGALLGRNFDHELLESVASLDAGTLARRLDQAVGSGLLECLYDSDSSTYTFKHALIQDNAYGSLLRKRRRELHARVADTLKEKFPALVKAEPETLGRHCEEAGQFKEAIALFQRAGLTALGRSAFMESVKHLGRARDLLERLDDSPSSDELKREVLLAEVDALIATNGYSSDRQRPAIERAHEFAQDSGTSLQKFRGLVHLCGFHCVRGDRAETLDYTNRLEILGVKEGNPFFQLVTTFFNGANACYSGDQARALELLTIIENAYLADPQGPRRNSPLFLGYLVKSWALAMAGHSHQAWETIEKALSDAEEAEVPWGVAQALSHMLEIEHDLGHDLDSVHRIAQRNLDLSSEHSLAYPTHISRFYLGWVSMMKGEEEGVEAARQAIEDVSDIGMDVLLGYNLSLFAEGELALGRIEEGLVTIARSLGLCETNLGRFHEAQALRIKGALLTKAGALDEAREAMRSSLEVASAQQKRLAALRAATALVELNPESEDGVAEVSSLLETYSWFPADLDLPAITQARAMLEQRGRLDTPTPQPS